MEFVAKNDPVTQMSITDKVITIEKAYVVTTIQA